MGEQLYGLFVKEWSRLDRLLEHQLGEMEVNDAKNAVAAEPHAAFSARLARA
jgi:hypothetical protein